MKKKIAVLIVGQIRTNSLGKGNNTSFENEFKQSILNDEILKNYDVNIFFVTDRIIKEKAYNYFGEKLKGIMETDYEDIDEPLNLNELLNKYMEYYNFRKNNPDKFPIVTHSRQSYIYMFYKLYIAYKLMIEYEVKNDIKHDYILKIRPDCNINSNLNEHINYFENNNLEIMVNYDSAYFGRYDIMCHICKLILCYGKYNFGEIKHDIEYTKQLTYYYSNEIEYLNLSNIWSCWCESPEVQLFEHILNYCYNNNINYKKLSPNFGFSSIYSDRYTIVDWDTK